MMAEMGVFKDTTTNIVGKTQGSWHCDAKLGSGAFGIIHIWSNIKDDLVEKITTKQLRVPHDDPVQLKKCQEQWCQEVKMFSSLCHENVVRVFELPPDIKAFFANQSPDMSSLPVLCMEFCDNGSLRSILNRTENIRGVSENECLNILKHVTSGLEYLHQRKIIHRDLKPENVVSKLTLARNHDGKKSPNIFKLIDLGFAKELGPKSMTSSFVGTLQYAAPELFNSDSYNKSVDFWSLGVLTHEIITGIRPFFHNNVPKAGTKDWINVLSKKSHETISIQTASQHNPNVKNPSDGNSNQTERNDPEDAPRTLNNFETSRTLSTHHRLSKTFKEDFASWLQLLLEMNPQKRGHLSPGNMQNNHEEHDVFSTFHHIISKTRVAINLMNMPCVDLVMEDSTCTAYYDNLLSFKSAIEKLSGISSKSLLLLLSSGNQLASNEDYLQFTKEIQERKETKTIFAYDVEFDANSNPSIQPKIHPSLMAMLKDPKQEVSMDSKLTLAEQIFSFMRDEISSAERLDESSKMFIEHLLHQEIKRFSNKQDDIQRLSDKALIKFEYFVESLLYDLDQLSKLPQHFSTADVAQTWENTQNDLQEKVANLSDKKRMVTAMVENCSSAYAEILGCKVDISDLRGLETYTFKKLENLKKSKRSNDEWNTLNTSNNIDFAQLLAKFLKQRNMVLEKLFTKYSNMLNNFNLAQDLSKRQTILKEEYEICLTTITKFQFRRQLYSWNLMKTSLKEEIVTNKAPSSVLTELEDYNIQDELKNSRRLISENNTLWDNISFVMKQF